LSFLDVLAHLRQTGEGTFQQAEDSRARELRRFVMENRSEAPFHVQTAFLSGEARAEILRELQERPVGLLVLGTHGRGGLERLVMGSVASTLARKASCSVLAISPEAALSEGIASAIETQTMPAWHRSTPIDFLAL
jgi:nucleotide-binding universal stress UspA family protein